MELRVLQYFLAVARAESITAAARDLHLTQPTLSRQLGELEKELGKPLFSRGSRKITLTEEGRLLRKRAEEILSLVGRTEQEIGQSHIAGDIYIGTGETQGVRLLAKVAAQLQEDYPGVHFHLVSGDAQDVCEGLDRGLLDFGLLLGDIDKTKYHYLELPVKDTWGVLMPAHSPLAQKDWVSPEDLQDKPLILSRQSGNKSDLYRWLKKESEALPAAATYNPTYNASLLVEEGMGYAFTLEGLVNTRGQNLAFRPLKPRLEMPMYFVWKKYGYFSKTGELFLKYLEKSLEEPPAE